MNTKRTTKNAARATPGLSCAAATLLLTLAATMAQAASPQLVRILPRGGQRGTEAVLTFAGSRLGDAQEVLIYRPGITVVKIEQSSEKEKAQADRQVKVIVKIAPDAELGEYGMRLRTASGLTEYRTFWVGPYATVAAKKGTTFQSPQAIAMNVTVEGVIENEEVHYFLVEAKKGQRIAAEIEGMRLGNAMFDPYVAIVDENRFELAASDDTALLKQDSAVAVLAPRDGKYIVQVRDSAFGGSGDSHYRLHVGTFARPLVVYPLGGQAGQSVSLQFLGDPKGPIARNVKLPEKSGQPFELLCEDQGTTSPMALPFRVSDFASVNEVEPNDLPKTATAYTGPLPVAFNGIISAASEGGDKTYQDADYFRFSAKKGQALDIQVYARRLGSPLDPVLTIYDSSGRQTSTVDDSGGPDPVARLNVGADGTYTVRVRDHLRGAGPMHAYRIEITPVKPAVDLAIPQYTQQYTQERQAVTVPRGNRYATLVRATRKDAGGAMTLAIGDLPAGVKVTAANFEPGADAVPVLFEADAAAPIAGKLVHTTVKAADEKATAAEGRFHQVVELVHGQPNQTPYYQTSADRMAVAVAKEAPFSVQVVQPKVPLVQGGQMNLKVKVERKKEFTGAVTLHFLFRPPGIEAASTVEVPAGKDEALYPINASDGAAARKWKIVVLGSGDVGGTAWVSSPFAELEVAPPMLTAKIPTATVEQGKSTRVVADLDIKTPWPGAATVELIGLPAGAVAEPIKVTAEQKKIEFALSTLKTTPAVVHNSLFLRVMVTKDGEPIVHNIARGGTLRVDAPLGAKGTTKPAAKETPREAPKKGDAKPKEAKPK